MPSIPRLKLVHTARPRETWSSLPCARPGRQSSSVHDPREPYEPASLTFSQRRVADILELDELGSHGIGGRTAGWVGGLFGIADRVKPA